ncbi:hypothetical protein C8D90_10137 [Enterobacillus tribolii]|uniref:Uncharacterized protein n=1 Tax=Enterobacillus tribolii TaxID=1487935 RepID=A0A370R2E5_9GAMM|nr:hypothetical protein C8D90_10137 [Enterobacillus tribolii]
MILRGNYPTQDAGLFLMSGMHFRKWSKLKVGPLRPFNQVINNLHSLSVSWQRVFLIAAGRLFCWKH